MGHAQRFSFGLFSVVKKAYCDKMHRRYKKKSDGTRKVHDSNMARKNYSKHLKDSAKYNTSVGYLLGCFAGLEVISRLIEWIINRVITAN